MEDSRRLTDPKDDRDQPRRQASQKLRCNLNREEREQERERERQRQREIDHQREQDQDRVRSGTGRSRSEFGDDECSTDSGCSSGGSTGSAERLSRRGSAERLCRAIRSPRSHCYVDRLRGRPTRSQERLSVVQRSSERVRAKSSRSWSPGDVRALACTPESPSYSPSPSDAHSSSDSDSLKRPFTANTLRRAFQSFRISPKEKKHAKKSPKRILRSPVSYTYARGPSGLPTQRVPRNMGQVTMPCLCQDPVSRYQ